MDRFDGHDYSAGDLDVPFTIQSIARRFVLSARLLLRASVCELC
ncbi:MAG: hypothetical protein WD939_08225 [Dehalococcoidia bacterium]